MFSILCIAAVNQLLPSETALYIIMERHCQKSDNCGCPYINLCDSLLVRIFIKGRRNCITFWVICCLDGWSVIQIRFIISEQLETVCHCHCRPYPRGGRRAPTEDLSNPVFHLLRMNGQRQQAQSVSLECSYDCHEVSFSCCMKETKITVDLFWWCFSICIMVCLSVLGLISRHLATLAYRVLTHLHFKTSLFTL